MPEGRRERYRSRADIVAEILQIANDGVIKTKIMYKAFLSFSQVNDYISTLTGNGLLEFDEKQQLYKTTKIGHKFLTKYEILRL